jgi:Protein of unknown function (DUF2950)
MISIKGINLGGRVLVNIGGSAAVLTIALCPGVFFPTAAAQSVAQQPAAVALKPAVPKAPVDPPEAGQQTYASAAAASQALLSAVQKDDRDEMIKVLGPDAAEILSSGDPAEDKDDRAQFVQKYQQMHRLLIEPNGLTTLYIGSENWPTPIPLVHSGKSWYFDTAAGKNEILYRRVGENELTVIHVCTELVDAQKEYYAKPHDGGTVQQYASKIMSDPGKHNGLYWEAGADQTASPLGPMVAAAEQEGYPEIANQNPEPFHGYYFRVLKGHGPKAPGGAKSYIADGKMTGGFAFVAYPAEYRSSGVMTFLVDQDGVVYQKDLGRQTAQLAKSMTRYDRDATWKKAD